MRERQKTFRSDSWPHSLTFANSLSWNGFFYTGVQDLVFCHHCGIALNEWKSVTKDPIVEHIFWDDGCCRAREIYGNRKIQTAYYPQATKVTKRTDDEYIRNNLLRTLREEYEMLFKETDIFDRMINELMDFKYKFRHCLSVDRKNISELYR